jgi:asparagine synthetase B (glutamine-hydrolysing)
LANLFAAHDPNPAALDETLRDLQQGGEFASVWRPAAGWVAAAAPLPGGLPDDDRIRQRQFAFAEGRDRLVEDSGQEPDAALTHIADLADHRPEALDTLPGDFGFIRFRADGEATVVRSCGGLAPFYISQRGARWAVGTRLGDFVRYLPDEPRLDPLVNALAAASWLLFPDNRTFLAGVTILPRGYFARLDGQTHIEPYWNPRPARSAYPTPAQFREHAARLRELLIAKLERDLDPTGGNLLTLSGGVDSSSLAALAGGVVGRDLMLLSMIPRKERPDLVAHEMSFIEPLAQQYGFTRRWAVHWHERLVLELWAQAPQIVFHVVHPALCSLPGLMREAEVRVLVGGESADEVCGSKFTLPDWARQTSLWRLLTDGGWLRQDPRGLARWARFRLALLRGRDPMTFPRELLAEDLTNDQPLHFFHPDVIAEYQAWWDGQRRGLHADRGPWRYLELHSRSFDGYVPMNWEACSALGVRRSLPFHTREVFELAFACHPAELYGPDPGAKRLLRAALHDDVPHHNLYRKDKSSRDENARALHAAVQGPPPAAPLPEALAALLDPAFFADPPPTLDYGRLRPLTRLLIFVASLRARQTEKEVMQQKQM